jgi:putative oxidoreductase
MAMFGKDRLYIPALGGLYSSLEPLMLPLLRVALGVVLIPHGCQKLFGIFGGAQIPFVKFFEANGYVPGAAWVIVIGLIEFGGGLLMIAGLFTRLVALLMSLFMINAIVVTSAKGFFWTAGGAEYAILLLVVSLVFMIRGAGDYSLDKSMSKEF